MGNFFEFLVAFWSHEKGILSRWHTQRVVGDFKFIRKMTCTVVPLLNVVHFQNSKIDHDHKAILELHDPNVTHLWNSLNEIILIKGKY